MEVTARLNEDTSLPLSSPPSSSSPTAQAPALKLNFFDLIIEIRLKLHKELLVVAKSYTFSIGTGRAHYSEHFNIDPDAKEGMGSSLSLFRVNKQIYFEAIPILYRNDEFELTLALEFSTPNRKNSTVKFFT
ncbi:9d86ef3c-8595-4d41-876a-b9e2ef38f8a3-CDS [Sclerotinia trifoliorum]|uniref:9d86ef3c-8595-4d41-876a-b9e2ef38f8a3-CDS n=1 Tax=Sclerotinia trifoliorum TaxID=28548 RepID=A0A8H2VYR4_9HELO|nr:9d86ef3c-8595-4d41-876a-b9e2ef38f8a3-CDS [Sclerotinia trifoliorum]